MNPRRTEGRIYAPREGGNSLSRGLERALLKEGYVQWTDSLPALYVPQTNELQLTALSTVQNWDILTMANPAEIHRWCLWISDELPDVPLLSLYREPNGFWNGKLFVSGKPQWKVCKELDREVPYPIPLLGEDNGLRATQSYPVLGGGDRRGPIQGLAEGPATAFLSAFGLPHVLPEDHGKREQVWLEKESPLVINRVKE